MCSLFPKAIVLTFISPLSGYPVLCNWQPPFFNQRKGQIDRRKYFMIKSTRKIVADLAWVESATSWSPVRRVSDWATEAGWLPKESPVLKLLNYTVESLSSNNRLSRNENLAPVLHGYLTTGNKILWKKGEIAPQEQFLFFSTLFSI